MARIIFLLLVLANILFFAWVAGYLGDREAGREPERQRAQLEPERLRVTREGAEGRPPASPRASAPLASLPVAEMVCRRTGPVAAGVAEKLMAAMAERGVSSARFPVEEDHFWVFIPPNPAKTTEKIVSELKQLGVTEFVVNGEGGQDRGSISLGVFRTEEAAKEYLLQLGKKGVRSAKAGQKARIGDRLRVEARGDARVLDALLQGMAAEAIDCPRE